VISSMLRSTARSAMLHIVEITGFDMTFSTMTMDLLGTIRFAVVAPRVTSECLRI